jgi:hypothetical protein
VSNLGFYLLFYYTHLINVQWYIFFLYLLSYLSSMIAFLVKFSVDLFAYWNWDIKYKLCFLLYIFFGRNDYEMLLALDESNSRHGAIASQINSLPESVVQVCWISASKHIFTHIILCMLQVKKTFRLLTRKCFLHIHLLIFFVFCYASCKLTTLKRPMRSVLKPPLLEKKYVISLVYINFTKK